MKREHAEVLAQVRSQLSIDLRAPSETFLEQIEALIEDVKASVVPEERHLDAIYAVKELLETRGYIWWLERARKRIRELEGRVKNLESQSSPSVKAASSQLPTFTRGPALGLCMGRNQKKRR